MRHAILAQTTTYDHFSPMKNRRVAALLYPNLCLFEFAQVAEVFGLHRPEIGRKWYTFETVSIDGKSVRTQYGGRMTPTGGYERLVSAGTIIVPGWTSLDTPVPPRLAEALYGAAKRGARVLSICSGAFVLAEAGLLDGLEATTHWRYADVFRDRFPKVNLKPQALYVDAGNVLTSAGSAAGLDLLLHLVRRDFGPGAANVVARRLVVPPHRRGGQAQFVERPIPDRDEDPLTRLLEQLNASLSTEHTVEGMAELANMSERTLLRRFRERAGLSPKDWLLEQRLRRAQELLTDTNLGVDEIAHQSGFGSAVTLRHHFRRRLDTSPMAYRVAFRPIGVRSANSDSDCRRYK